MKKRIISLALSLATMMTAFSAFSLPQTSAADSIPAFPGAEGGGMYAAGGRGGTVVHVTNLDDSGAGSLRDAVSHGNRIVVFDVGGTINLKSDISCAGNITVAGQTAPGGKGITLKGGKFALAGDNTIVRFISSRPGEKGKDSDYDAWGGSKGSNSIVDHCSIGWANDEQWGLYSNNMNYTVQYTIIGPSNCVSYHSKGAHGFGVMFGKGQASWHHNLLCHSLSRNFRGKVNGRETMDFVNNVIYDWGYQTAYGTMGQLNYVNNYLKMGPSTKGGQRFLNMNSGTGYERFRFYLTGNKIMRPDGTPYSDAVNSDNWDGGIAYGSHSSELKDCRVDNYMSVSASDGADVSVAKNAESAEDAFEHVVSYAGASINPADNAQNGYDYNSDDTRCKIDAQVLYEARTGTGSLTGGREFSTVTDSAVKEAIEKYGIQYCDYNSYYPAQITKKEITDSDNDGMPDEWELERGLDPNNAKDATGDYLGQGYNNIEYYINDLTVNAFPEGVVTVSPALNDLGEDYATAKADADALKISPATIREVGELQLPDKGENGSAITWSSNSSAIVIKNNQISAVKRPSSANAAVTLSAEIKYGKYTVRRSFTVTVPALPYKFDFGGGATQSGYAAVSASTKYSSDSSYGFVDTSGLGDMDRAPYNIPAGYENVYADQIQGTAHFKAEIPNGKYFVTIHYGSWNTGFGTNYTVEGINSGNLYSTDSAQYIVEVEITDGILDVEINKGDKQYGGYINGLEISTTRPAPAPVYHFDFGEKAAQDGYTVVKASTAYSQMTGYGFENTITELSSMERAPSDIPAGYENLHADQIQGESTFKAYLPNGKYIVTIHYGSWNTNFGTNYTVEGISSGNLASTTAAAYTAKVEITDESLDIVISKGNKSYGGYINGLDIMTLPTIPYHFDFGDGDVQPGYTAVKSTTLYSDMGYGFTAAVDAMTRAPGNIPSGYENLYNDQLNGEMEFKADIPNGKYNVTIYYGSWNTGFGTNYTIEGVSSGNLYSTEPAQYSAEAEVTDGVLDVIIAMGDKQYGGYISGMDVEALPEPEPTEEPEPTDEPWATDEPTESPTSQPIVTPTDKPEPLPVIMPYEIITAVDGNEIKAVISANDDAPEAYAIIAQYDNDGALINVKLKIITAQDEITDILNEKTKTVRGFVWDSNHNPLAYSSYLEI